MNYFISSYRATVTMIARAKLIGILSFDSLPEWGGGYSTLGVFYFQIGQVDKCGRQRQVMPAANKEQLLQLALSFADRTL
jgi:hypothetical protein